MSKFTMSNENITINIVLRKRAKHKCGNKNVFEVFNAFLLQTKCVMKNSRIQHFKQLIEK